MPRKQYWISGNKHIPHNYILLKSLEQSLSINSISALGVGGEEIEIVSNPITVSSPVAFRYPLVSSDRLKVVIDHPLSEVLSLKDLLSVRVGLDNYETKGKYISSEERIGFNNHLSLIYSTIGVLDVFMQCTIHIQTLDNYNNNVYSASVPVSMNDDGWMIQHVTSGNGTTLPYEPVEDTLYILVGDSKVDNFTIDGKTVEFSTPEGFDCYVIYKPQFTEQGNTYVFSNDIGISPSYDLILRDNHCNEILFSLTVEVFNPDITSTNNTPTIKSLGLLTSDK